MFPNELHGVSYITSRRQALMWMDSETPGQNQFFVLVSCPLYMHSKIITLFVHRCMKHK